MRAQSAIDQFLRAHTRLVVALLCTYAALRILIFAAVFPLFNNVDEQYHLSSIRMYASGKWPGKDLPIFDSESATLATLYGSPEYLSSNEVTEKSREHPPLYQLPPEDVGRYLTPGLSYWRTAVNFEAQSTPVYYLLGAAWYRLGEALRMSLWELAYWLRFLNAIAYALLIWASYKFVRQGYPERVFLWIGVPTLLAVFPLDVFFGLNRDVLSAPMTVIALLLELWAIQNKERGGLFVLAASVVVGLTFLVNVSNVTLYGTLAATWSYWNRQSITRATDKIWIAGGTLCASLTLPGIWMLRNYRITGDLTGMQGKVTHLGWTTKPFGEILDHPLFSANGLSYFLTHLIPSFWRGEYVWHMKRMSWPVADWIYIVSSAVMLISFTVKLFQNKKIITASERFAGVQALFVVLSSLLFMAAISLPFDYHNCIYPSRDHPYFVSGRIISGALLPFVLIYVGGMEYLLSGFKKWAPHALLACLVVFITVTEFEIRRVTFNSPYNLFAIEKWHRQHRR